MSSRRPRPAGRLTKSRFRRVMSQLATGVTVVTTRLDDEVHGMTVSAVCSVSLEPLLVLICIEHTAESYPLLAKSGVFAVNILSHDQQALSPLFANRTEDKASLLATIGYRTGPTGAPIIDGCLAHLDCRVVAAYPGGDHTIFVGQVEEAEVTGDAAPLVFFRGRYTTVQRTRARGEPVEP